MSADDPSSAVQARSSISDTSAAPLTLREAWRKSRIGLIGVAVFSVFINLLKLAAPLYILQILDRVISSGSLETLLMLTLITLIAIATGVLLEVIRRRLLMHWGNWIELQFAPQLFEDSFQKYSVNDSDRSKPLRDLRKIRSFVCGRGLVSWLDVFWAPLFLAAVFFISPLLGGIVLAGILVALLLGRANEQLTRDSRNLRHQAGQDDRQLVAAAERHQEVVSSLSGSRNLLQKWLLSASVHQDESMRLRATNIYFAAALRFVGRLVRIAVLGVGIALVIMDQSMTLGAVVASNVLSRTAYSLVQNVMMRWRDMLQAKAAYQQVSKALKKKEKKRRVSRLDKRKSKSLAFIDATYRYPHQPASVFRGLNGKIKQGQVLCVIGPSASGKSTLCRLISGLMPPRSGKIRLGDVSVHRLQQQNEHREIGYLPQETAIFSATVRENIANLTDGDMNAVVQAASLAGIHKAIVDLPQGYDTEISEKEPLLSSGQRKAVALARAFYRVPSLIVLDEPFPHLDTQTRSTILSSIKYLKSKGAIIIFSTQRPELANSADQAIEMAYQSKRFNWLKNPQQIKEYFAEYKPSPQQKSTHSKRKTRSAKNKKSSVVQLSRRAQRRKES